MARGKKGKQSFVVSAIILIAIILVSVLPSLDLPFNIPSWDDAYEKAGLKDGVVTDDSPLSVHYIDVGQGDCILIKTKEGTMLIDSGERGNEDKILNHLKAQKIEKIDYLVATHPHSDHIGSISAVLEKLEVSNVILPKLSQINIPTTKTYENFLKAIKSSNAKAIPATTGDEYHLGDATFKVLSPSNQSENLNNMSVVIKLTYKNTSFLFTGDAEKDVEQELLNSKTDVTANVIKLGHHGSNTASTEEYQKAVRPQLAIITCGKDNSYGHPHKETINTLEKLKIKYKRADEFGTIVVGSDGESLTVHTEREVA